MIKNTLVIGLVTLGIFSICHLRDDIRGKRELGQHIDELIRLVDAEARIDGLKDAYIACKSVGSTGGRV